MNYLQKVIIKGQKKEQFGFYIGETKDYYLIRMPQHWFPLNDEIKGCILELDKNLVQLEIL